VYCTLEYVHRNFSFAVTWPNFVVSEEENLVRAGGTALPSEVAYPIGGDLVSVSYLRDLPRRNVRVGFSLKFVDRPVIPRITISTPAPLSMVRLVQL